MGAGLDNVGRTGTMRIHDPLCVFAGHNRYTASTQARRQAAPVPALRAPPGVWDGPSGAQAVMLKAPTRPAMSADCHLSFEPIKRPAVSLGGQPSAEPSPLP